MAGDNIIPIDKQSRLMALFDARWEGEITGDEEKELAELLKDPELKQDYLALEALAVASSHKARPAGDFYEELAKSLPDHPRRTPAQVGIKEPAPKERPFW